MRNKNVKIASSAPDTPDLKSNRRIQSLGLFFFFWFISAGMYSEHVKILVFSDLGTEEVRPVWVDVSVYAALLGFFLCVCEIQTRFNDAS